MLIVLPYPDTRLNPNARMNHFAKARIVKKARADANYATMAACNGGMREARATFAVPGKIMVQVTVYPPDKRNRDQDNVQAAMKASFDGIADALAVDDSRFEISFRMEPSQGKPGKIEVTI